MTPPHTGGPFLLDHEALFLLMLRDEWLALGMAEWEANERMGQMVWLIVMPRFDAMWARMMERPRPGERIN